MANHKSALKRTRSDETKRSLNKLQHKTARNAIKKLKDSKSKKDAQKQFPVVVSLIDKLSKNNITFGFKIVIENYYVINLSVHYMPGWLSQ